MSDGAVADIGGAFSQTAKMYGIDDFKVGWTRDANGIGITLSGKVRRYSVKQMVFEATRKIMAGCRCAVTIFNDIEVVA